MALVEQILQQPMNRQQVDRLALQMKDYVEVSAKLIWMRHASFFAATMLAAFYFEPSTAIATYAAVLFTEIFDLQLVPRIRKWDGKDPDQARKFLFLITLNTLASAGAICLFVIIIAVQQHAGGHFTPLFILFSAALFAAMNNHQLVPVLALRLSMYGATFLYIATIDIWKTRPPISAPAWLEFFTILFVLYFIVDVSYQFLSMYRERMRQLEKLKEEHAHTLAALEIKSQFLSTVSHELRTPLTSIKASLDLVNTGALGAIPEMQKPALKIAGKNSKRLANLINDLLDFQKIEAGEMEFSFNTLNVQPLVREVVASIQDYADELGVYLEIQMPDNDVFIKGDKDRLMQVIENLLSNALKFSNDKGTVIVSVTAIRSHIRISVQDFGVGIPASSKAQVFGQFSQVDSTDQRKVGGTGLGMSISKSIVERHGGVIDYNSKVGHGSVFYIEFGQDHPDGIIHKNKEITRISSFAEKKSNSKKDI